MFRKSALLLLCALGFATGANAGVFEEESGSAHQCQIIKDRISYYENHLDSPYPRWEYGRKKPYDDHHMLDKIAHFEKIFNLMKCRRHYKQLS